MIESFLRYIRFEKRYSPHTLVAYETDLYQLSEYLQKQFNLADPAEADHHMLRSWLVETLEQGITPRSAARKIASFRSYYKFLRTQGHILNDPSQRLKTPKVKKRLPAFVEEVALNRLLDNQEFAGEGFSFLRDRMVLDLLYGTGMRLSELISLTDKNINVYEASIRVTGKGNKTRVIPLHKELLNAVKYYLAEKNRLGLCNEADSFIVTDDGKKTYPMFIQRLVKKYIGMVSTIEKKSPHVLRHSFATHLLNHGADLNAIKELLGHANLAATQVYTHNSLEKLKEAFNQAHPKA